MSANSSGLYATLILSRSRASAQGSNMEGTQILAIATAVVLVVGFLLSEVSRKSYERGKREGWARGRSLSRQEFWQE